MSRAALERVAADVGGCRACPRLVAWREEVAQRRPGPHHDQRYWARGVPGIGDPGARLLVVGLAPAAHGANRTGVPFSGDSTGAVLLPALERAGFVRGSALVDCWLTNAVKCVPPSNLPTAAERHRCAPLLAAEAAALPVRVVLALGAVAWDASLWLVGRPTPKPRFGHGAEVTIGSTTVLGSYHPSRQNTNTGRLTPAMLGAVIQRARDLLAPPSAPAVAAFS